MRILISLAVLTFVMCQGDHLLMLLKAMHASQSYHALPAEEKVIAAELLAAAEVDQVTHYVDQIGFTRLLVFIDHVNKINATEAHLLERYLVQELNQEIRPQPAIGKREISRRDLQSLLKSLKAKPAYQNLTQSDKDLMEELITTADRGRLTPVVYREGYSRIIALVEHLGDPQLTHNFLNYLIKHLNEEAMHHTTVNPQPVG